MNAFLELIALWEQTHGRKATQEDKEQILRTFLNDLGIYERADGMWHREDFEAVWKQYGIT